MGCLRFIVRMLLVLILVIFVAGLLIGSGNGEVIWAVLEPFVPILLVLGILWFILRVVIRRQ